MAYQQGDSIFGRNELSFGPGNLYWDTGTGGANIYLGGTDSIKITAQVTKIDLMESQKGARPADKAISSQVWTITAGLSRATLDRLNEVVQGIYVQDDTSGNPKKVWLPKLTGQLDTSIVKQLTFKEIVDGEETAEPFGIFDFWKACPSSETTELTYDATTQRFYGVAFITYESDDAEHLDPLGRATYGASRDTGE